MKRLALLTLGLGTAQGTGPSAVEELHPRQPQVPARRGQAARARQDERHARDDVQAQHAALQHRHEVQPPA